MLLVLSVLEADIIKNWKLVKLLIKNERLIERIIKNLMNIEMTKCDQLTIIYLLISYKLII